MTWWLSASALLGLLALTDLRQRRLPNHLVAMLALLLLGPWWLEGMTFAFLIDHAIGGLIAFLTFGIFYALRWMAGGDVKLAAAVLWWAGFSFAAEVLLITALCGIALAVAQWLAKPYVAPDSVWHVSRGTPYGVALAAGGLWAVWRVSFHGAPLF